jgi:hypothetical protein
MYQLLKNELLGFKFKCRIHSRTGREGPEGEKLYSSSLSLSSVIDGVGGQRHDPVALPSLK